MPNTNYPTVINRQKREQLKRALSLVFKILVILEKLIDLLKKLPL